MATFTTERAVPEAYRRGVMIRQQAPHAARMVMSAAIDVMMATLLLFVTMREETPECVMLTATKRYTSVGANICRECR